MSLHVCGDTHCPRDIHKLNTTEWPEQRSLNKNDILVILGDCGLIWDPDWSREELHWANWLANKKFTVCFIDGNHENFARLNKFGTVPFYGGTAGVVFENENGVVYHLKRGEVYTIENKTIFTFGGAQSTDKERRIIGRSWWPEEVPNFAEINHGLENLEKHHNCVDFILTHTAPTSIITHFNFIDAAMRIDDPTSRFLEEVDKITQFKQWHFGHFHTSQHKDMKYICHYNWYPYKLF